MRAASMKMFLLVAVLALLSRADVAQARRHYVPGHGRWLQRDPAGYVDGMSLYEYVSSRPTVLPTRRASGVLMSTGDSLSTGQSVWV